MTQPEFRKSDLRLILTAINMAIEAEGDFQSSWIARGPRTQWRKSQRLIDKLKKVRQKVATAL